MAVTRPDRRLEDARYRRFGMMLGIGIAFLAHLAFFALPSPNGLDKNESQTQRGVKARVIRMGSPNRSSGALPSRVAGGGATGMAGRVAGAQDLPLGVPPPSAAARPPAPGAAPSLGAAAPEAVTQVSPGNFQTSGGEGSGSGAVGGGGGGAAEGTGYATSQAGAGGGGTGGGGEGGGNADPRSAPDARGEAWQGVLAELEEKQRDLSSEEKHWTKPAIKLKAASGGAEPVKIGNAEDVMDPRIRLNVVSYPPSGIEQYQATIPYPKLKVRRRELTEGICRVYYRVWTDGRGKVVKRELKTPATPEEKKLYAQFVEAVTKEVETWPFDRVAAEIHVDVLFDLREAE
jgi:hypothetical protein